MIKGYDVILKLLQRYDYAGALEIMYDQNLDHTTAAILMDSCRYAVNFDFKTASRILSTLPKGSLDESEVRWLRNNLRYLIGGQVEPMFSELIENILFKIAAQEYIDFLGRVNRCREAILKYMFVKKHINRNQFTFHDEVMQKRDILRILKKKYHIYNSNLVFGIVGYMNHNMKVDYKYMEIVSILTSTKMQNLIELRNESIVGHGFVGVGKEDIYRVYGNPYWVLDDFKTCLSLLDLDLHSRKYDRINQLIAKELELIHKTSQPYVALKGYHFE